MTYSSLSLKNLQSTGCGGKLTGRHGSFNSPMHPDVYPNSQTCDWVITVPSGGQPVTLSFTNFIVEGAEGVCAEDVVEVYDGADDSSRRIGQYCGTVSCMFLCVCVCVCVCYVHLLAPSTMDTHQKNHCVSVDTHQPWTSTDVRDIGGNLGGGGNVVSLSRCKTNLIPGAVKIWAHYSSSSQSSGSASKTLWHIIINPTCLLKTAKFKGKF